ncbi:MAG TPA: hypothetical protein PLA71_00470 [Saccharofermentans sp.]|nr:hypothetical protein [Saccharofermentans sp.]
MFLDSRQQKNPKRVELISIWGKIYSTSGATIDVTADVVDGKNVYRAYLYAGQTVRVVSDNRYPTAIFNTWRRNDFTDRSVLTTSEASDCTISPLAPAGIPNSSRTTTVTMGNVDSEIEVIYDKYVVFDPYTIIEKHHAPTELGRRITTGTIPYAISGDWFLLGSTYYAKVGSNLTLTLNSVFSTDNDRKTGFSVSSSDSFRKNYRYATISSGRYYYELQWGVISSPTAVSITNEATKSTDVVAHTFVVPDITGTYYPGVIARRYYRLAVNSGQYAAATGVSPGHVEIRPVGKSTVYSQIYLGYGETVQTIADEYHTSSTYVFDYWQSVAGLTFGSSSAYSTTCQFNVRNDDEDPGNKTVTAVYRLVGYLLTVQTKLSNIATFNPVGMSPAIPAVIDSANCVPPSGIVAINGTATVATIQDGTTVALKLSAALNSDPGSTTNFLEPYNASNKYLTYGGYRYYFTGWTATVNPPDGSTSQTPTFSMPAAAVTVTANFRIAYKIDEIVEFWPFDGAATDSIQSGNQRQSTGPGAAWGVADIIQRTRYAFSSTSVPFTPTAVPWGNLATLRDAWIDTSNALMTGAGILNIDFSTEVPTCTIRPYYFDSLKVGSSFYSITNSSASSLSFASNTIVRYIMRGAVRMTLGDTVLFDPVYAYREVNIDNTPPFVDYVDFSARNKYIGRKIITPIESSDTAFDEPSWNTGGAGTWVDTYGYASSSGVALANVSLTVSNIKDFTVRYRFLKIYKTYILSVYDGQGGKNNAVVGTLNPISYSSALASPRDRWQNSQFPASQFIAWRDSTYAANPPYVPGVANVNNPTTTFQNNTQENSNVYAYSRTWYRGETLRGHLRQNTLTPSNSLYISSSTGGNTDWIDAPGDTFAGITHLSGGNSIQENLYLSCYLEDCKYASIDSGVPPNLHPTVWDYVNYGPMISIPYFDTEIRGSGHVDGMDGTPNPDAYREHYCDYTADISAVRSKTDYTDSRNMRNIGGLFQGAGSNLIPEASIHKLYVKFCLIMRNINPGAIEEDGMKISYGTLLGAKTDLLYIRLNTDRNRGMVIRGTLVIPSPYADYVTNKYFFFSVRSRSETGWAILMADIDHPNLANTP